MPNTLKHSMADELRTELDACEHLLVVGLNPMDAAATHELRTTLRGHGAQLRVIHNRTSRHALDERRKALGGFFKGQTAVTLAPGEDPDIVGIAKALVDAQRLKRVDVRGGFVDGEVLDGPGVELLARSPDKPTLRAMLCGAVLGPARGLAAVLQGVPGGLARCLQARIDKQEENAG